MKILFLCTAFNSLSQRVALVLKSRGHAVTVELALSPELMVNAAELAAPDIIICPFLTKRVPPAIYNKWLTLIVHPGPPGDAGPSALDWTLLGDLGEFETAETELATINATHSATNSRREMRSHWGVTVLQAIEAFDAGPVWAFDQFELDHHASKLSKSDLYRGPVTRAAVNSVLAAVEIVQIVASQAGLQGYPADLTAPDFARTHCVSRGLPFLGGKTHDRPLLKASSRDFFQLCRASSHKINAETIVQRIRCGDSQPGVLTSLFGPSLFVYNAVVQKDPLPFNLASRAQSGGPGTVLATRDGAVLVEVGANYPIWISHIRRPKAKADKYLHPKVPATMALLSMPATAADLGLYSGVQEWSASEGEGVDVALPWKRREGTYQQVWVELEPYDEGKSTIGYVHSEFYNGAFSTTQCEMLLRAVNWTLAQPGLKAIVMLGGTGYFSNGIALNVIEGSSDPSAEGWANINAIDDCVQALLAPAGVVTFSAIRGNAAAGGLALATATDVVLCAESAVLNPHYRGIGLYGSEWHTYSWSERCGADVAAKFARDMMPMSSQEACKLGLVDYVIANDKMNSDHLLSEVKSIVRDMMTTTVHGTKHRIGAPWTRPLRPVTGQVQARFSDYMLRNKAKFLAYTFADEGSDDFTIQQHFQKYRQHELGQMTLDFFHPHRNKRFATRCTAFVRKLVPTTTALRFALHRRYKDAVWATDAGEAVCKDEEEMDEFDSLNGIPASAAIARLPLYRPEYVQKVITEEEHRPEMARSDSVGSVGSSSCPDTASIASIASPASVVTPSSPLPRPMTPLPGKPIQALDGTDYDRVKAALQDLQLTPLVPVLDLNETCLQPKVVPSVKPEIVTQTTQETPAILWACYYAEDGSGGKARNV